MEFKFKKIKKYLRCKSLDQAKIMIKTLIHFEHSTLYDLGSNA
jgi:hypothetical protein